MLSRYGHNDLAAHIIEGDVKQGGSNFSKFYHEALTSKGDPWQGTVREVSALKKADWSNRQITPLHCASINPDIGPLEALFRVSPDVNVADGDQKKLVHYAAACKTIGPIKFLAEKGANMMDTDKQGLTPLLTACKVGRAPTAQFIIEKCSEIEIDEVILKKFGKGGVNRPGKDSWCPLHLAVSEKHYDVVDVLFKHGANPDKQLSSTYDKVNKII